MVARHKFREEEKKRHISPKTFIVRCKYETPEERLVKAQTDASFMLSNGEIMSTRKPFVFRAHDPLASNCKGFQFRAANEQERVADNINKNELFETDNFDKKLL